MLLNNVLSYLKNEVMDKLISFNLTNCPDLTISIQSTIQMELMMIST